MFDKILFLGRDNCNHTLNIYKFLKKRSKKVHFYKSRRLGEKIKLKKNHLLCDYIISFKNYYILKKNEIKKAKYSAINFHPSPPKYRGLGPVNYSIYNRENFFGCTAHIINHKIDSGPILNVRRFKVKKTDGVEKILNKTYKCLEIQAKKVLKSLLKSHKNLERMEKSSKHEKWSKKIVNRNQLENFYQISNNLSAKELERKILATKYKNFKPYIVFKKKKFELVDDNEK